MDKSIIRELKSILGSDHCRIAPEDLLSYSYDGSHHRARPEAVVFPQNNSQVVQISRFANHHRLPLIPRGAGTGLTGGAIPIRGGLVMVMEQMDRIIKIDSENMLAVVEPGLINGQLQEVCRAQNLFFPPDPASAGFSTIGGNVAVNAGGIKAVKYGVTKDYVMGLEAVLAGGTIIHCGSRCLKDVVGYDLTSLFVGSEGTLGTITQVTLRLLPLPETEGTISALFQDMVSAAALAASIRRSGTIPAVIEFMDHRCLQALDRAGRSNFAARGQAMLLMEVDGNATQVAEEMQTLSSLCKNHGAIEVRHAEDAEEREDLWRSRRSLHGSLSTLRKNWLEEDISVPISQVAAMLEDLDTIGKELDLDICCFGHLGDGNIHISYQGVSSDLSDEKQNLCRSSIYRALVKRGGRIAAEHGIGIDKANRVNCNLDPPTLGFMSDLKKYLDPNNILNPGKLFPPGSQDY